MSQTFRILALLSGTVALGCTGAIDNGSGPGGSTPGTPGTGGPGGSNTPAPPPDHTGALNDAMTVPGTAPLRRLTRVEYDNTVRDLLGVSAQASARLTADQGSQESGFTAGGSITGSDDARGVLTGAEDIAAAAAQKLPMLLPCNPVPTGRAEQDSCGDQFVEKFGLRAFRRPLGTAELAELRALYRADRAAPLNETFEQAIGAVITAILQTPQFLYHWEVSPDGPLKEGTLLRLAPYELASRLSYLFWASMPDDALFTAAQTGKLNSPDDIAREAGRLLADNKAKQGLQDFFVQWLETGNLGDLVKDPSVSMFTPALAQAMGTETKEFVASLFFGPKGDGKLESLLTSPSTVIDASLAKLYGVTGFTGTGTKATDLDPTKRAGIFTQASFLTAMADAVDSHPIKRGDAVLRRVLCTELIIPATLVVPPLPDPKPGQSTRERFSVHHEQPCATCHTLIDPIGFAFEHYDAIGGWRTMDYGKPVDATGTFKLNSGDIKFDGAVELMKQLAGSIEARECMATQWLRYTLRRREATSETPSLKVLQQTLGAGADMRQLMVAATKARTFTHRAPSPGEVSP
jgi:uncharacterized protein DUF1592/uncharacterized protein DUF1588/uncharacterized protein DUF1595/uncharacterized protein DUF1587/uncharacterized protein DUF1585